MRINQTDAITTSVVYKRYGRKRYMVKGVIESFECKRAFDKIIKL